MKKFDVYGIGNALVDTEYEIDDEFLGHAGIEKGVMTLIESEERARLIHLLEVEHEHKVIEQCGGGSAANTIVAAAQLGGQCFYSCKVGDDPIGEFFLKDLAEAGITTHPDTIGTSLASGQCISMVTADAERSMTTHLGISSELSDAQLDEEALAASKYLYIEGYLVTTPSAFAACKKAQAHARANDCKVTLTLSDPAIVGAFSSAFDEFAEGGIDILFCNEDEAKIWTASETREEAASKLKSVCSQYAMTCGSEGALVFDGNDDHFVAGVPTKAVDTTGAGDIFAGAFLYALSQGEDFPTAAALANRAASKLVSAFGARLTQAAMSEVAQG